MTRVAAIAFAGLAGLCLASAARAMPVTPAALATTGRTPVIDVAVVVTRTVRRGPLGGRRVVTRVLRRGPMGRTVTTRILR